MTWTKLDDSFWSNPKVLAAGNEAAGAFARMLSYCGDHLTEGKVPDDVAKFITRPLVLKKLVEHRFVERNGRGWLIPDYLEFNPTKAEALATRQARAEAGRLGGLASGITRRGKANA